jgi:hypothetical protein
MSTCQSGNTWNTPSCHCPRRTLNFNMQTANTETHGQRVKDICKIQYCPAYQAPMCCSSSTSSLSLSSSSHSALSRPVLRIANDATHPRIVTPAKRPQASASPLGLTRVDRVKSPPDRNGPILRPAAERVWARPLSVPRVSCDGAELLIYGQWLAIYFQGAGIPQNSPKA